MSDFNQCCGQPMFWINYKPVIQGPTNDDWPEIITEFMKCNYMEPRGLREFCENESLFRSWHLPLCKWQGWKTIFENGNIIAFLYNEVTNRSEQLQASHAFVIVLSSFKLLFKLFSEKFGEARFSNVPAARNLTRLLGTGRYRFENQTLYIPINSVLKST